MNKIIEFINKNAVVIYWTIAYIALVWCVLWFMFGFDMFDAAYWHKLFRAHLRGFPGFVFMIFLLAAGPLYIATTAIILRTKKSLLNISLPQFIKKVFTPTLNETHDETPIKYAEPDKNVIAVLPSDEKQNESEHNHIPTEMREHFRRAQQKIVLSPQTVAKPVTTPAPTTQNTPSNLPLPNDFDAPQPDSFAPQFDINTPPQFHDIDFNSSESPENITDENATVKQYLESKGIKYQVIDDVVVTDKYAIASHTDSDFWIADVDTWFASGRSRPSPIATITRIASNNNLTPVLYLGADNIMDLETIRGDWNAMGIRIITTLNELN